MKRLIQMRSTNGRWGIEICSSGIEKIEDDHPVRASVESLGNTGGFNHYRVEPTSADQWLLIGDDLEAIDGALQVERMDLQSGSTGSIVVLSSRAIVKWYGYKGRSSGYALYINGEKTPCPVSVMLALGLIKPNTPPEPIAPPPEASGALAEALRKAGLA